MIIRAEQCGNCNKKLNSQTQKNLGILSWILLAILPKCPFCILAYTSTAVLCGKNTLMETQHTNNSIPTVLITSFFCSLILISLLLNFRGKRTKYALALAGLGVLMILISVILRGGEELYFIGVLIVSVAIWLNGSLISIVRKIRNSMVREKITLTGIKNSHSVF